MTTIASAGRYLLDELSNWSAIKRPFIMSQGRLAAKSTMQHVNVGTLYTHPGIKVVFGKYHGNQVRFIIATANFRENADSPLRISARGIVGKLPEVRFSTILVVVML